jgi:hypothetical protein
MNYRAASQKPQPFSPVALGLVAAALTMAPAVVHAQGAPTPLPAAGYAPPPAGYAPPPAGYPQGYPPPQVYVAPQAYYAPALQRSPVVINDWDENQPAPAGYHVSVRNRTGLIVGGAVTFGVVYGLTASISAIADAAGANNAGWGLVPVVGPFGLIPSSGGSAGIDFLLVLDGLAQAGGVAMFIAGFAAPKKTLVRNDMVVGGLTLKPMPMTFDRNSAGFGVRGSF